MIVLEGIDALHYLQKIQASEKWNKQAQSELTAFMLGLPTDPNYKFEIVAGKPVGLTERPLSDKPNTGGRPRLQISKSARVARRKGQKRDYMRRIRSV